MNEAGAMAHARESLGLRYWLRYEATRAKKTIRKRVYSGLIQSSQVKSRPTPQMTHKPNTQNRAPLMCLSGQPAFKVRLAASSKRDGKEWAWVVNVAPTAAAVWAERTARSGVMLRKILVKFFELVFLLHWNVKSAPLLLRSSPRSLLYE